MIGSWITEILEVFAVLSKTTPVGSQGGLKGHLQSRKATYPPVARARCLLYPRH
ncbi:hypothetical protein J2T21_000352 [Paeniglutamicibacter psychrophenolicus]|nr:hypothetical protein [Paeniglutamicibacter psychrophenolicus]